MVVLKMVIKNNCIKCNSILNELEKRGLVAEILNIDKDEKSKKYFEKLGFEKLPILSINDRLVVDTFQMKQEMDNLM